MSQDFKVVVTDQVFPSIDTETQLLAEIGARIEVADRTADDVARVGRDADALLNTYLPITDRLLGQLPTCKIVDPDRQGPDRRAARLPGTGPGHARSSPAPPMRKDGSA